MAPDAGVLEITSQAPIETSVKNDNYARENSKKCRPSGILAQEQKHASAREASHFEIPRSRRRSSARSRHFAISE